MKIFRRLCMSSTGLSCLLFGCLPGSSRPPTEEFTGKLVAAHGSLYIQGAPPGAKRGHVFVVASRETIPGGSDRARIGLVKGLQMHERSLEVTEVCRIPDHERPALANGGLLVAPLREDTRARVKNCLARYSIRPDEWDRPRVAVDLTLDVGLGDDVRQGDRYDVQGDGISDSLNLTVTGFELLGQCVVQETIHEGYSLCRLDRKQWPLLTRDRALAGGYALLRRTGTSSDVD